MQENITETIQSTGSMSFPATPSPTPPTVVAVAISSSATIPTNPSSALTNAAVVVVTTTTETSQHIHNASVYLAENDELEYSEYRTNKETVRQYLNPRFCKQAAVYSRKLNPSWISVRV